MADRDVRIECEDIELIVGALREARQKAVERVAATPMYQREARAGTEATRDRLDRIAATLAGARFVVARVPERGE